MHPATFALCVPLTLPLSSLGVVLVAVAFLADIARRQSRSLSDSVDSGSKTVLFARGAGPSRRPCVCCVSVWVSVRVVVTPVVFNVQSAVFVVDHFASISVALRLVPLSRCQVRCNPDALLSHFFSEVPVSKNRHPVISAVEGDCQRACVLP